MIKVTCPLCGSKDVRPDDVQIVHNLTYDTYSYVFICCGKHNVKNLAPGWVTQMIGLGSRYMTTEAPKLSRRPDVEPLTEQHVIDAVAFMNNHDYLASYCEAV